MSKNEHIMIENGVNFHKLIKGLSTNALKYLINIAKQETNKRRVKRTFPEFENKDLPNKISFDQYTKLLIRNTVFQIDTYDTGNGIQNKVTNYVEIDLTNWKELTEQKHPISVTIKNSNEQKIIELHSRSKIFWLINLIIQSDEDIDNNVERYNQPEIQNANDIHF